MVGYYFFRIGKNLSEIVVSQVAGKAVCLKLFGKPFRLISAGAGNLNRGIADIGYFFECFGKAFKSFGKIMKRIELSTDFHDKKLLCINGFCVDNRLCLYYNVKELGMQCIIR